MTALDNKMSKQLKSDFQELLRIPKISVIGLLFRRYCFFKIQIACVMLSEYTEQISVLHFLKTNLLPKKPQELNMLLKIQSLFLKNYSTSFRVWDNTTYISIYSLYQKIVPTFDTSDSSEQAFLEDHLHHPVVPTVPQ